MPANNTYSKYLIVPNTLRKLAGKPDKVELLEHLPDDYSDIDDGTMSVEIITLSQHKYELAFEAVTLNHDDDFDMVDISERVDAIIDQFDHIRPHIKVHIGDITIIVDCAKIDTQIVEYASTLLSQIPCLEPGYTWEYLTEKK